MYKSKLQELCHQYSWNLPEYTAVKDGPDHSPRFRATVTVNDIEFQTPSDQFRSSKEAQNQAAKIAFDHFTAPKSILQKHSSNSSAPIPSPHSSGSPMSSTNVNITPAKIGVLQASHQPSVQTPKINAAPVDSKEISHLYKNRLQTYAQKKNIAFPTYSCETDGPPHARCFKSTVTIDGKNYEASGFYSTLKEAEHAAAKVASESLQLVETHEEETLYKSLLQELTQKEGFGAPTYETINSGPPHMPTFQSTVEIKGETFQGQEAKTKKQAEMNAAKVAYKSLIERRSRRSPGVTSPGCHNRGPRDVSCYRLKSTVADELPPNVTDDLQPNARAKANILIQEKRAEEGKDTKINATGSKTSSSLSSSSSSSSSNVRRSHPWDPFPSTSSLPENGPALAPTPLEYYVKSETEAPAHNKVLVCPRNLNLTYPEGSTILPFGNEKWMAVKLETS